MIFRRICTINYAVQWLSGRDSCRSCLDLPIKKSKGGDGEKRRIGVVDASVRIGHSNQDKAWTGASGLCLLLSSTLQSCFLLSSKIPLAFATPLELFTNLPKQLEAFSKDQFFAAAAIA